MAQLQQAQGFKGRCRGRIESQALQVLFQIRQAWLAHGWVLLHGARIVPPMVAMYKTLIYDLDN